MVLVHRRSRVSGGPLHLHMSRTEIADYLGLTVETVSRSIGKLKKRSIISLVDCDEVVVLDDAALSEIGNNEDNRADPIDHGRSNYCVRIGVPYRP